MTALSALLSALFGAMTDALLGWLKDKRAEQNLKDVGRLETDNELLKGISEIADDQAKLNAADRSVQSVIDSLRTNGG